MFALLSLTMIGSATVSFAQDDIPGCSAPCTRTEFTNENGQSCVTEHCQCEGPPVTVCYSPTPEPLTDLLQPALFPTLDLMAVPSRNSQFALFGDLTWRVPSTTAGSISQRRCA